MRGRHLGFTDDIECRCIDCHSMGKSATNVYTDPDFCILILIAAQNATNPLAMARHNPASTKSQATGNVFLRIAWVSTPR